MTLSGRSLNFNCSFKYRLLPNGLMIFLHAFFLLFPMSCHTVLGRKKKKQQLKQQTKKKTMKSTATKATNNVRIKQPSRCH